MPQYSGSLSFSISTVISQCYPGDTISFALNADNFPTSNNFTMSFNEGLLSIDMAPPLNGAFPYATSSAAYGNFALSVGFPNKITFNSSLSSFVGQYIQVASFQSGSAPTDFTVSSSLYNNYGDISYPFDPQVNDRIYITSKDGRYQVLNIISIVNGTTSVLYTAENIDSYFLINPDQIDYILIAKRLADETNIIFKFKKPPGATSYGFLIPDDVNDTVLQRISTLQTNVQQQLLSTQQNSG